VPVGMAWRVDAAISKAYVFDKYSKNGEYFVDLIWWIETLDKDLILEGFATVKLALKRLKHFRLEEILMSKSHKKIFSIIIAASSSRHVFYLCFMPESWLI